MNWYDANRRVLPWREDPTPYHVWLSEIMLQQTRVEAGKEYYLRFLRELPDIASLASAPEDQCLKLWEGLGYYSRVRNLQKAAVLIMGDYGGKMPENPAELQKLPGIGPYTAAAIASIAFGAKVVSVDGNLVRVFARVTEYGGDAKDPAAKKAAEQYFSSLQPADRPGDFNQALMDLGAMICLPNGDPLCDRCPWGEKCQSHRDGLERHYPVMPEKKKRRVEDRTVLVIRVGKDVVIHRRPHQGLLADLYEFPNTQGHLNQEEAGLFLESLGFLQDSVLEGPEPLGEARHVFSHVEWKMTGYAFCLDEAAYIPANLLTVSKEELDDKYSIPSAFRFYKKTVDRTIGG